MADRDEIIAAARSAGVVGARYGIPTHIKLEESVEVVVANGCESEPLLFGAKWLMTHHAREIVNGLELAMTATGARRGIVAHLNVDSDLDAAVRAEAAAHPQIDVFHAPGFYPACEAHTLTHETTGRVVPDGGTPASVGVGVFDVETLFNLSRALDGTPVTHRTVTVAGEVAHPGVVRMPLGASLQDAIDRAGGPTTEKFRVLVGGPASGALADDTSQPITKTTAAVLVLPAHHIQVQKRTRSIAVMLLRARSTCFHCSECTEHCTRHLAGCMIEPHKIMQAICFSLENLNASITSAVDCGGCGVCDSFVCKMGVSPRVICRLISAHLEAMGWEKPPAGEPGRVTAEYATGHVSVEELISRLGVEEYVETADLRRIIHADAEPEATPAHSLAVPLLQHVGAPAVPVVGAGDNVDAGQAIGEIPQGRRGARVHAAVGGTVGDVGRLVEISPTPETSANHDGDAAAVRQDALPD
ncbi:MAG: SLBB domain-containing protein [Planctomycetes bacterium]|nr:SLBB domain-containing protein [Planctomycetota bacterium]